MNSNGTKSCVQKQPKFDRSETKCYRKWTREFTILPQMNLRLFELKMIEMESVFLQYRVIRFSTVFNNDHWALMQ